MKNAAAFIFITFTPHHACSTSESIAKQAHTRRYDPFNKEATCYTPLHDADANSDGLLSEEEYTQFIIASSDGAVPASDYGDLAFELQVSFVYLDCLCGNTESGNCCNGKKFILGKVGEIRN
jgi:hypothetical protein